MEGAERFEQKAAKFAKEGKEVKGEEKRDC
jgi:hypothetical protein